LYLCYLLPQAPVVAVFEPLSLDYGSIFLPVYFHHWPNIFFLLLGYFLPQALLVAGFKINYGSIALTLYHLHWPNILISSFFEQFSASSASGSRIQTMII
jgi:hypothetical protein